MHVFPLNIKAFISAGLMFGGFMFQWCLVGISFSTK